MILTPMIPYVGTGGEAFSIFSHYVSQLGQIGQASIVPAMPGFIRILGIPVLFIACLPSIGFNYILFTRPRGESLKKLLALAVFFSQPISLYIFILPMTVTPFVQVLTLTLIPTILSVNWAFLILIVVPFIQREVNPENKSSSNTACDYFFNIVRKPSKLDAISLFLGLCIMFIPFIFSCTILDTRVMYSQVTALGGLCEVRAVSRQPHRTVRGPEYITPYRIVQTVI